MRLECLSVGAKPKLELAFCTQTKQKKESAAASKAVRESLHHVVMCRAKGAKRLLEEKKALAFFCQNSTVVILVAFFFFFSRSRSDISEWSEILRVRCDRLYLSTLSPYFALVIHSDIIMSWWRSQNGNNQRSQRP